MHTSRSYSSDLKSHVDGNGTSGSNTNLASGNGSGGGVASNCSSTSTSTTNLSMPDISPSSSQFFEVMYVGKIKVSHKRVPFTFIDDSLPKFKAYDTQRTKMQEQLIRRTSQTAAPAASDINNLETLEKITMMRRRYSTSDGIAQPTSKFSIDEQRKNSMSITEEGEMPEETDENSVLAAADVQNEKIAGVGAASDGAAVSQNRKPLVRQQSESAIHLE